MSELSGNWSRLEGILNPEKIRASLRQVASRVGNFGASQVKKGIVSGAPDGKTFVPLSLVTIARKGSSKPLIQASLSLIIVTYSEA